MLSKLGLILSVSAVVLAGNLKLKGSSSALIFENDAGETTEFTGSEFDDMEARISELESKVNAGESCYALKVGNPSLGDGMYKVKLAGMVTDVYCDMTTDGGGWLILGAWSAAAGENHFMADVKVNSGDPFSFNHYKLDRANMMAAQGAATLSGTGETLFKKADNTWMKANKHLIDQSMNVANRQHQQACTITANDGTTASAKLGYATYGYGGGGDIGVVSGNFDNHGSSYIMLNSGCDAHYFYSYGAAYYEAYLGLGSWSGSGACTPGEGEKVYIAIR